MSVTIEINGIKAVVDGGYWKCDDPELMEKLSGVLCGSYRPDLANASAAIERLGGHIVSIDDEHERQEPYDPNLLY